MNNQNFSLTISVKETPEEVFRALTNVRGWWSKEITGGTARLNDEFQYAYQDMHRCKIKIVEVIQDKKVVWHVLENHFSFTEDKTEWKDTRVNFEITKQGSETQLNFTHVGLVPEYECYSACTAGWTQYIKQSLVSLITTGKGLPNSRETSYTTHEVALRFNELAQQEKWFEIQDELFADNVKSIEPAKSTELRNAEGKAAVRKKGEEWVSRIEAAHRRFTTQPIVGDNHFCVGREVDITVRGLGRIQLNEIMMYEVKEGKIVSEQFFY
jgi:uncharacterized protein YndB with AHSA1/START domain